MSACEAVVVDDVDGIPVSPVGELGRDESGLWIICGMSAGVGFCMMGLRVAEGRVARRDIGLVGRFKKAAYMVSVIGLCRRLKYSLKAEEDSSASANKNLSDPFITLSAKGTSFTNDRSSPLSSFPIAYHKR